MDCEKIFGVIMGKIEDFICYTNNNNKNKLYINLYTMQYFWSNFEKYTFFSLLFLNGRILFFSPYNNKWVVIENENYNIYANTFHVWFTNQLLE